MNPEPIQPAASVEVPAYIPDELLDAYAEWARQQVRETWSKRARTVTATAVPAARGPLAGWPAEDRALALVAGKLGLTGWTLLVALWSWLAWTTGSGTWITFAVVGLVTLAPGIAALAHLSGRDARGRARKCRDATGQPRVSARRA